MNEIQFTVRTFQKLLAAEKHRLAIGVRLRDYIHSEIEAGRNPDHYRVQWMEHGIRHVIAELEKIGRAFNAAHPNDKFSTADMIDIAHSATLTLRNYIQPEEADADPDAS